MPASHSDGRPSSDTSNSATGPQLLTTAVSTNKTLLPQAGDVLSIEVQTRNPRRRFPLSDEFLPRVSITRDQIELLKRQCIVEMNRVLRKSNAVWAHSEQMFDGGSGEWRSHFTSKQHHLTLYRRKHEDSTPAMRHFVARGQVSSVSLKDLEYGLYCDTTTDERAVKTDLYRDLFLDAAVLRVFERQRSDDAFHFFGLKWLAYISPADKFVSPRDYACVEYSRTISTQSGEKLLVKVVLPVDAAIVTVMPEREYDLVRGAMACTSMYRFDPNARAVQVFAEGSLDPSGSATSWLGKSFLTHFAPTVVNLDNCADVKHFMKHGRVLSTDAFLQKVNDAKQTQAHKHCAACLKTFSSSLLKKTTGGTHHASCRCCGQVMCSRCVIQFTLCLPWHEKRSVDRPSAVIDEKFCLKCVCLVRAHRNEPNDPTGSIASDFSGSVFSASASPSLVRSRSQQQQQHTPVYTPSGMHVATRAMEQLNFEDAPLPSQELLDQAHQQHKPTGVDRLRLLKERHLAKDKHRNLGERAAMPEDTALALNRMEQGIAEQEELLRNIQFERMRREQQQRLAFQQYQQQLLVQQQQQQQYFLQHATALSASQSSSSARSSQWKPTSTSTSTRMTDASITSSAYTADTFESFDGADNDDAQFCIMEESSYDVPSPARPPRHPTSGFV